MENLELTEKKPFHSEKELPVIIHDLCTVAHKTTTQKYISDVEIGDISHKVQNFTYQILKYKIYMISSFSLTCDLHHQSEVLKNEVM